MRPSRETAGAVRADGVIAARPAWQRRSDSELSAALARVDRHAIAPEAPANAASWRPLRAIHDGITLAAS